MASGQWQAVGEVQGMIFLLRYWKYIAALALLAAVVAWVLHYGATRYDAGEAAGTASEHALWQADTKARDETDAAIRAQNAAREAQDRERNDAIVSDYAKQLAAAAGSRDEYFRLLQRARQVHPVPAPEAGGAASPVAAGETDIAERIDRATAAALAESRANADQLDALIAVVKPQM